MRVILTRIAARTPIFVINVNHAWHIAGVSQDTWFCLAILAAYSGVSFYIKSDKSLLHISKQFKGIDRLIEHTTDGLLGAIIVSHCLFHHGIMQMPNLAQVLSCLTELVVFILVARYLEKVLSDLLKEKGW